ncbi:DUF938 domain-containing protein [Aliikangiella sp. IMCC44359]|uniref:DUF938 domain-containing protein n=1 Tax=Aliikangiella sp. IMCC44359 TaxID=3459125 RepID=UPI00403A8374
MHNKPFSEACERNSKPILEIIKPLLKTTKHLLEIGSGTGQHAVFFAKNLPHITWHTSDQMQNHQGILSWVNDSGSPNLIPPISLNVLTDPWPTQQFDAVFSANTAHIMCWSAVKSMFSGVANRLNNGGVFILYGPFNYNGEFTSPSNQQFETWLKSQDHAMGIRDFEAVNQLAENAELNLQQDNAMPANNRLLVWKKQNPAI